MKNKIGNKMFLILVGVHDLDYGLPGLVRVNLIFFSTFYFNSILLLPI